MSQSKKSMDSNNTSLQSIQTSSTISSKASQLKNKLFKKNSHRKETTSLMKKESTATYMSMKS